jgi:predicted CopG family antitoxin
MPSRKMVSLTEETYKSLVQEGTLEDTFDTVIQRLIKDSKREKVAASGQTLAGTNQTAATESLSSEKALVKTPEHE